MKKPDAPRETTFLAIAGSTRRFSRSRRSSACLPVRKRSAHRQETPWLMTVASAAPDTPMSSAKMNSGSSARLQAAPMTVVSMPTRGKPWALMKPFRPVASMVSGVPSR